VGLDWTTDLSEARTRVGNLVALQGNLDPAMLYASPKRIQAGVASVLASYGSGSGHVFNLGHGVAQDMLPEHIGVLVDAVHELSKPYHLATRLDI
jgi:uroporphyrinogen decarboxylase